jgi:23S rRNA pseudouridine1911/1915/1917 synthase
VPGPSPEASPEWRVLADEAGARLDKWLAAPGRLGSRGRAAVALERGQVFLNGDAMRVAEAGRRLAEGDRVRLWRDRPGSASVRGPRREGALTIVYEDDALLVADKPAGLLTVPTPGGGDRSLADLVATHWRSHGKREPMVVHRIDRDTSGLVIFAKDPRAWAALRAQFARREPERVYLAVVRGVPVPARGVWRSWLRWDPRALRQVVVPAHGKGSTEAVTRYAVTQRVAAGAALEVRLVTGRQHQVRVQAWHHGHPLVGERLYIDEPDRPRRRGALQDQDIFPRQALHARRLGFLHPRSGLPVSFESPIPADLQGLLLSSFSARGPSSPR